MIGWKTLASKTLHENPHLKLIQHDVIRPNGRRAPYFVVERPVFSIIIPVTPKNEIYLVGQYRYAMDYYSWEFPMGAIKEKKFLDIAQQELIEETGLVAQTWKDIGYFHIAHGFLHQEAHVFIAKNLIQKEARPEIGEFLKVKKVTLLDVGDMIARGEILDGPTICAYHLLEVYLNKIKV